MELQKLAGLAPSPAIESEKNTLLNLRMSTFTNNAPSVVYSEFTSFYCRALNSSRNFMYMSPELATAMRTNILSEVQTALIEYEANTPYWFVSRFEGVFGEGVITPFYDYHTIFQAKALILQEPYNKLVNYLDVPAVPIGDLYYIQNLITLIEMGSP
ncbi:MAG: hypothetical protein HC806_07075 [Anaerolineae bacterium]|nr:hypothetical protein [Anaerolineae bacterium]